MYYYVALFFTTLRSDTYPLAHYGLSTSGSLATTPILEDGASDRSTAHSIPKTGFARVF